MIYIISGASRSGKSILAKKMLEDNHIPYLPVDAVMMGFMNGVKDSGIHDKMWPNEIARELWGFLSGFIETLIHQKVDYLLEGEAFLPELVHELMRKYPGQITVGFMGYNSISLEEKVQDVKKYPSSENDWLKDLDDQAVILHVKNMIDYSMKIKMSCEEYQIPYFEIGKNFNEAIKQVHIYMTRK